MHKYINHFIKKSNPEKNNFHLYNSNKNIDKNIDIKYQKILTPISDKYIIFDFETTGLSPYNDRIIEIGAIKVINNKIVSEFNELIDPERKIPPFISQKIHITDEMVFGKRKINEVLIDFLEFIQDFPLVAHNANFDMSFLICSLNRLGLECQNPAIDTLYLSRKYFRLPKNSLSYLTDYFDIQHNNAHRAFADVMALFELYKIIQNTANKTL